MPLIPRTLLIPSDHTSSLQNFKMILQHCTFAFARFAVFCFVLFCFAYLLVFFQYILQKLQVVVNISNKVVKLYDERQISLY